MTEAIPTHSQQQIAWAELEEQLPELKSIITPQCPTCDASEGQWRGYRVTRKAVTHRRWCKHCGKWFVGFQYAHVSVEEKERLLNEKLHHDSCREAYEYAQTTQ